MNDTDIKNKSDKKSIRRSAKQHLDPKLYKVVDNNILYTVSSSNHDKRYIVTIQLLELTSDKLASLSDALNGNIKISCTCPGFLYRGYKYISYKANAGIEREDRSPDKTNPQKKGMACKHILAVLDRLKSDYNSIYSLFKESTKNDPKSSNKPSKDNKNSDSVTEHDLEIIDEFNKACTNLYKSYTEYLNGDHSEEFTDSDLYNGVNPSEMLSGLSKPAAKLLSSCSFVSKLNTIDNILNYIEQKKNGFNVLLRSDISSLTRKLNSLLNTKVESIINNIILNIIEG